MPEIITLTPADDQPVSPLEKMLLRTFERYEHYARAATTPGTKLVSGSTMTRRTVLAANPKQLIATVNTIRERTPGQQATLAELDYNEAIALPAPGAKNWLLAYIEPANEPPARPDIDTVVLPDDRAATMPRTRPYGRETVVNSQDIEWGLAPLVQESVRQWFALEVEQCPGKTVHERERAFALGNFFMLDPESMGRALLNPGNRHEPQSPFHMLITLRKQLEAADRRAVLYRLVGMEALKLLYAMRMARTVEDPRGKGLKPEPLPNDNPSLLKLARFHAAFDQETLDRGRKIGEPIFNRTIGSIRSLLRA